MPDLLTTREVADRLRRTTPTVAAMVRRGELAATRTSRGYLIDAAELARWLAERATAPACACGGTCAGAGGDR